MFCLQELPTDLGKEIVSYGSLGDAARIKSTCTRYRRLVACMDINDQLQRKAFNANKKGTCIWVNTITAPWRRDYGSNCDIWIRGVLAGINPKTEQYKAHLLGSNSIDQKKTTWIKISAVGEEWRYRFKP